MKIYFAGFGCKVNSSEDEFFLAEALTMGYEKTNKKEEANVIIVNGCAVTQVAAENCNAYIAKINSNLPHIKLIVTGCIAEEINNFKNVTIVPNNEKNRVIAELAAFIGNDISMDTTGNEFCGGLPDKRGNHTRAFFKIQDGCDAFCSYCIIPTLRGAPISKPMEIAVKEFKECASNGFKEIVLVGIHIGLYGKGMGYDLISLLKELLKIEGNFRIRLSSVEVNEIDDELISLIASNKKLCNHLHIPLQSGSDRILQLMKRKYDVEKYIETVKKAKSAIGHLTVGSDVIVGFPGETEEDFQQTINTIKEAGTDFLHVFPYSDRKGTKASEMEGKLTTAEKEKRSKILRNMGEQILNETYNKSINKTFTVLTEKNNKGHSENYLPINIASQKPVEINEFKRVVVTEYKDKKLFGILL